MPTFAPRVHQRSCVSSLLAVALTLACSFDDRDDANGDLGATIGPGLTGSSSGGGGADDDGEPGSGWDTDDGSTGDATGPTDGGTDGADSTGEADEPEVPDNAYCSGVADWMPAWAEWEEEVLELVNDVRAAGATCPSYGDFPPTHPLTMDPALRCAARAHCKDMNDRAFFSHTNPDGEGPADRIGKAGYAYSATGENIATGQPSPAEVMVAWMDSAGHCRNILSPDYEDIGVGYYPGGEYGHLWTQTFGAR